MHGLFDYHSREEYDGGIEDFRFEETRLTETVCADESRVKEQLSQNQTSDMHEANAGGVCDTSRRVVVDEEYWFDFNQLASPLRGLFAQENELKGLINIYTALWTGFMTGLMEKRCYSVRPSRSTAVILHKRASQAKKLWIKKEDKVYTGYLKSFEIIFKQAISSCKCDRCSSFSRLGLGRG